MTSVPDQQRGVLYTIVCASSSAFLAEDLVREAQQQGWIVCVITTPQGTKFFDTTRLAEITGYPVRSEYKHPDEPDVLPRADALVVFPATFNTINKWALGISDTLAVGLLSEYTGLGMPIVAVPCFKTGGGLDTNPAFPRSIRMLRRYTGVRILYQPDLYPPKNRIPVPIILKELHELIDCLQSQQREEKQSDNSR